MPISRAPWRHEIRDHAVDADGCQDQRDRREQRQQHHRESTARQRRARPARPSSSAGRSAGRRRARESARGRVTRAPPPTRRPLTTTYMARAPDWVCGTYSAIRPSASRPYCFTRPTTPTTVSQGLVDFRSPKRIRLPSASWPGQSSAAMNSSTSTTRVLSGVSSAVKSRPARERDIHRLEIAAGGDADVGVDEVLSGRRRAAFDRDRSPGEVAAERQRGHAARGRRHPAARRAVPTDVL